LSWLFALRDDDDETFSILRNTPVFIFVSLAYAFIAFIGYANTAFTPLYAIETLGVPPALAGLVLGGAGALSGIAGAIGGGILTDRLAAVGHEARRITFVGFCAAGMMLCHAITFSTHSLFVFYSAVSLTWLLSSACLGGASGIVVNSVPARQRGVATATFLLATNLIGLALGPYVAGKLSVTWRSLGSGMMGLLWVSPIVLGALVPAFRAQTVIDDRRPATGPTKSDWVTG